MAVTSVSVGPRLSRDESVTLFGRTMGLVAVTAGFFAAGAYLGRDGSEGASWLWFLAAFGCLLGLNTVSRRAPEWAASLLFGFGVLMGLATASTISYYASTEPHAVWQAGGATALFVGAFGAAGYGSRRDLSYLARWLFWGLVALLLFGVVLIFVDIPNGALIYAVVGLALFAGLTMFDFQRLRRERDVREAPLLASSIFLDGLNVFLFFVSIFGGGTRD